MSSKIEILLQDSRTNLIIITQTSPLIQIYFPMLIVNYKQNFNLRTFVEKISLIPLQSYKNIYQTL